MRYLLIAALLSACESTTEVRYVHCETMTVFPNDSIPTVADSVAFSNCDNPSWDGTTIRRKTMMPDVPKEG